MLRTHSINPIKFYDYDKLQGYRDVQEWNAQDYQNDQGLGRKVRLHVQGDAEESVQGYLSVVSVRWRVHEHERGGENQVHQRVHGRGISLACVMLPKPAHVSLLARACYC